MPRDEALPLLSLPVMPMEDVSSTKLWAGYAYDVGMAFAVGVAAALTTAAVVASSTSAFASGPTSLSPTAAIPMPTMQPRQTLPQPWGSVGRATGLTARPHRGYSGTTSLPHETTGWTSFSRYQTPMMAWAAAVASGIVAALISTFRRHQVPGFVAMGASGGSHAPLFSDSGPQFLTPFSSLTKVPPVIATPLLQPKTVIGELLQVALRGPADKFDLFVRDRIEKLSDEQARQREELQQVTPAYRSLYRRINDVKVKEQRQAVEDVLYYSVLQRFQKLGVSCVGPQHLQGRVSLPPCPEDFLSRLVDSPEEAQLVETHLKFVLRLIGTSAIAKMCKVTLSEVFGSCILFGYFLRRSSKRFALIQSCGLQPRTMSLDEARDMLQYMYDRPSEDSNTATNKADSAKSKCAPRGHAQTLEEYIDALNVSDLPSAVQMSQEATTVVKEYIRTLVGDADEMLRQVKEVMVSADGPQSEIEQRLRLLKAMADGKVEALIVTPSDLRRLALEAVSFGWFLQDAESTIELAAGESLLTPTPSAVQN